MVSWEGWASLVRCVVGCEMRGKAESEYRVHPNSRNKPGARVEREWYSVHFSTLRRDIAHVRYSIAQR